jgi:hypothetical protein
MGTHWEPEKNEKKILPHSHPLTEKEKGKAP